MSKLLSGLESEKKWVDNHPEFYDNSKHQEQVKRNIETRHRLNELNKVY
ncbi:conserved hypothetical protein [Vibrio phage 249E41-1]|nr:conserved hypothetical protein [Vibrio phage 249E41-1]